MPADGADLRRRVLHARGRPCARHAPAARRLVGTGTRAAAPADALPAAETAEMTATETEETAAQPVGFTVGNLSEVPNTCGGY